MHRRCLCTTVLCLMGLGLGVNQAVAAKAPSKLELFGQPLQGASREKLREVLKNHGMREVRLGQRHSDDVYDATAVLQGASQFQVGYAPATEQFAYAQYTFPGFMKMELVSHVIRMVSSKYGPPHAQSGNYKLGKVSATWRMGPRMEVRVHRGWPDTTTYLTFTDTPNYRLLQTEKTKQEQQQIRQKALTHSHAF